MDIYGGAAQHNIIPLHRIVDELKDKGMGQPKSWGPFANIMLLWRLKSFKPRCPCD